MATSLSLASNGITFQDNTTLISATISAAQLSTGGPTWSPSGNVTVYGSLTANGNITVTTGLTAANLSASKVIFADSSIYSSANSPNFDKKFKQFRQDNGDKNIYIGQFLSSFISQTGKLYTAGYTGYGMGYGVLNAALGVTYGFTETPIPLPAGDSIASHYVGSGSLYVITTSGYMWSVGYNGYADLGLNNGNTNTTVWQQVSGVGGPISNVTYFNASQHAGISYGSYFAIASGNVYAWGYNTNNNPLGMGYNASTPFVQPTPVTSLSSYPSGYFKKVFTSSNTYDNGYSNSFVIDINSQLYGCGHNTNSGLGVPYTASIQNFIPIPGVSAVNVWSLSYSSNDWSYVLSPNGTLYGAGYNGYGQLGLGNTTTSTSFSAIISNVKTISVAQDTSNGGCAIALLNDGTVRTWGYNNKGQCGTGGTATVLSPYNPAINSPGLINIKKVAACGYAACTMYALDSTGNIWAAGYNAYGQCGDGSTTNRTTFVKAIKNNNVFFVDFDVNTQPGNSGGVIAVDQFGNLYGFGQNQQGQLGTPYTQGWQAYTTVPMRSIVY